MEKENSKPIHQSPTAEGFESMAGENVTTKAAPPFRLFAGDAPDGGGGAASGGSGSPLPVDIRQGIEQLSGLDMGDVRVHQMSARPAMMDALAFAQGEEIHLGPGQGHLLAHEAWHVAQQKQGRVRGTSVVNGVAVNEDGALEREADVMGAKALEMKAEGKAELKKAPVDGKVVQFARTKQTGRTVGPSVSYKTPQKTSKKFKRDRTPRYETNPGKIKEAAMKAADRYLNGIQARAEKNGRWDSEYESVFAEIRQRIESFVYGMGNLPTVKLVLSPSKRVRTRSSSKSDGSVNLNLSNSQLWDAGRLLAGHAKDYIRGGTAYFRILDYCSGKKMNKPGAGGLMSLAIEGNHLVGRPGFDSVTQTALSLKPGQARRHIVPWHTLRTVIDKLYQQHGSDLIDLLSEGLETHAPKEILNKVAAKTDKMGDKSFGKIGKKDGAILLQALYVMNSNVNNLWIGNGSINSTINSVLGPMKSALDECQSKNELKELLKKWSKNNNKLSEIGKSAKALACELLDFELNSKVDAFGKKKTEFLKVDEIKLRIRSHVFDSLEIDGLTSEHDGSLKEKLYDTPKMGNLIQAKFWLEVSEGVQKDLDGEAKKALMSMLNHSDHMEDEDEVEIKDEIDEKDDVMKDDDISSDKIEVDDDSNLEIGSNEIFNTLDFDYNPFLHNSIWDILDLENDYWGQDFERDEFIPEEKVEQTFNWNDNGSFSNQFLNPYERQDYEFNQFFGFNQLNNQQFEPINDFDWTQFLNFDGKGSFN